MIIDTNLIKCLESFEYFTKRFFEPGFTKQQLDYCDTLTNDTHTILVGDRRSGTTTMARNYAVWKLLFSSDTSIFYYGANLQSCNHFVKNVHDACTRLSKFWNFQILSRELSIGIKDCVLKSFVRNERIESRGDRNIIKILDNVSVDVLNEIRDSKDYDELHIFKTGFDRGYGDFIIDNDYIFNIEGWSNFKSYTHATAQASRKQAFSDTRSTEKNWLDFLKNNLD